MYYRQQAKSNAILSELPWLLIAALLLRIDFGEVRTAMAEAMFAHLL